MKIQFDTNLKTVRIEEIVLLSELIEKLEFLLPNGQWKEWRIETNIIYNWQYPIIFDQPIVAPKAFKHKY